MKNENFMSRGVSVIGLEERSAIDKSIRSLCDEFFGEGRYDIYYSKGTCCFTCSVTPHIFHETRENVLRLQCGNLAKFRRISIFVTKQKGYDTSVEGDYIGWKEGRYPVCDLTQLSANINVFGDWRKYRTKNAFFNECVEIDNDVRLWTYESDSEAAELIGADTRKLFGKLVNVLKNAKHTKIMLSY